MSDIIQPNDVILFQGDSITDCHRVREATEPNPPDGGLGRGYAMLAAGRLLADRPQDGLRFYNRGVSGDRVVDLYARWKIDALNLQPTVLSILVGVNDTGHEYNGRRNGVEPTRYERIYRELLQWTRDTLPGVRLVLGEPFVLQHGMVEASWLTEMAERRAIVKALAGEFNAVHVPYQAMFDDLLEQAPAAHWMHDGIHPTPAGHTQMADLWLESVLRS